MPNGAINVSAAALQAEQQRQLGAARLASTLGSINERRQRERLAGLQRGIQQQRIDLSRDQLTAANRLNSFNAKSKFMSTTAFDALEPKRQLGFWNAILSDANALKGVGQPNIPLFADVGQLPERPSKINKRVRDIAESNLPPREKRDAIREIYTSVRTVPREAQELLTGVKEEVREEELGESVRGLLGATIRRPFETRTGEVGRRPVPRAELEQQFFRGGGTVGQFLKLTTPETTEKLSPADKLKLINTTAASFRGDKRVQDFQTINTSVLAMQDLLQQAPTAENLIGIDQALVVLFNKVLDPRSVVRESEFARTPEGTNLINRTTGLMRKWFSTGGQPFTDVERKALTDAATTVLGVARGEFNKVVGAYRRSVAEAGLDPTLVIPSLGTQTPTGLPTGVTEADIQETIRLHPGETRESILRQLQRRSR